MQDTTQVVLGVYTESSYQGIESEVIVNMGNEDFQKEGQYFYTQKVQKL